MDEMKLWKKKLLAKLKQEKDNGWIEGWNRYDLNKMMPKNIMDEMKAKKKQNLSEISFGYLSVKFSEKNCTKAARFQGIFFSGIDKFRQ